MIINRLSKETSPYLQQHAENPVDWYPWGENALEKAKSEKKPILLSIGYSACHWCHVMAHESFEDIQTAEIMNKYFINIKVDREERPDLDKIYQTSQILLNQRSGGWPLTMFLSHENQAPFFGGTYFPNVAKYNLPSFKELLIKVHEYYQNNYNDVLNHNKSIIKALEGIHKKNKTDEKIDKDIENKYIQNVRKNFDQTMGGFGSAPKFPQPGVIMHILNNSQYHKKEKYKDLNMALFSLLSMQEGGINDQLGGGFFRYSVDDVWMIPHFEKMLYDQAQMISLYSLAFKVFKDEYYKNIAIETIDFLNSNMLSKDGLYFAAMDADTDGEEGKYYSFNREELDIISKNTDLKTFTSYYNIDIDNPWESDRYLLLPNKNNEEENWLKLNNFSKDDLNNQKRIWESNIIEIKKNRTKPRIDDKIIVSWNSLAITGLVDAFEALNNQDYLDKAINMFEELKANSFKRNKLVHTYKENQFQEGVLEDYAYLAKASMRIFQATGDESYFNFSKKITDDAISIFKDDESDLLRYSNNVELFTKLISVDDGVIPSPNSILAEQLFNIGHVIFDDEYLNLSNNMVSSVQNVIDNNINSYSVWANNILNRVESFYEIAVIGPESKLITDEITNYFTPNTIVVQSKTESILPLFIDRFFEDETYIYVCQNKTCQRPETNINLALEQVPYIN